MAQHRYDAERQKGTGDEQEFGLLEGYEAGNQDPRSNGSQGTKQRIFQGRLIVAGSAVRCSRTYITFRLMRRTSKEKPGERDSSAGPRRSCLTLY
jgi:hypothetical protein